MKIETRLNESGTERTSIKTDKTSCFWLDGVNGSAVSVFLWDDGTCSVSIYGSKGAEITTFSDQSNNKFKVLEVA